MPGPLFNFSAYLGALFASKFGYPLALGSAVAWLGLFGPGVTLMFASMPYWTHVRRFPLYRYALPGALPGERGVGPSGDARAAYWPQPCLTPALPFCQACRSLLLLLLLLKPRTSAGTLLHFFSLLLLLLLKLRMSAGTQLHFCRFPCLL